MTVAERAAADFAAVARLDIVNTVVFNKRDTLKTILISLQSANFCKYVLASSGIGFLLMDPTIWAIADDPGKDAFQKRAAVLVKRIRYAHKDEVAEIDRLLIWPQAPWRSGGGRAPEANFVYGRHH